VADWTEEDTQIPGGNTHLWEESWDDDDTSDEFAVQLRLVGMRPCMVGLG
jgi:26 proteasome complex subunit DSS1